jgi:hypothetical protein
MVFAEGIYVGYKYYQSQDIKVKYPFGYGLSYTQFEYTNFNCNQNGVSFTVKNIGERDGATVAQIYVQKPEDFVSNPKELKAFKKIYLKSGESKKIEIEFDEYAFRMWNIEKACWEVGGDYHISLGENSRDLLFEECIHVGEENYTLPEGYLFKEEMSCETFGAVRYKQYYAANLAAGDEDGKLKCYKKEQEEKSKRSGNSKQKHKRIVATYSTIIRDLWYAKGFMGKVFGFIAYHYSTATDKLIANSMSYLPLRSLMQFMGLNSVQAQGMVEACNGKFFTGLKKLIFKK